MATSQDFVNWVCSEQLDYRFLKYVLLAENRSFLRFASGTTHQTIYFPEVKAFHICLPPVTEQKAIAHILGTLDDKIELNRRMNETLEAMARAIFKSWFVDFDPVRAKMDGRQPLGMDVDTAALFPDGFEHLRDGELLPRGWRIASLHELSNDGEQGIIGGPFGSTSLTRET
jgi:type I restriction enzyme S subunit